MVAPNIFEQRSANVVHKTINPSSARLEVVAPVVISAACISRIII